MEYIVIGIFVVCVITAVIFMQKKKTPVVGKPSVQVETVASMDELQIVENQPRQLIIQMEMLPAETIPDRNELIEITDSKVLSHLNNFVPGFAQAVNATNNVVQSAQANGEVLYRAIIPAGAKLADSQTMKGAVRGIYHEAAGIRGHANWVAVETPKGGAIAANTAAAAMGVASMVVGQYYMTQINAELGTISDDISKVSDFQDNEYRSRVFSLIAHVKKVADFELEILENDELRLSKISQLNSLEEECTQLLGQANLTLAGFAEKTKLDYKVYEKTLREAQNWFMYQKSLLDILCKVADLRYTLHLGKVSREQCIALLPIYSKQVSDTQDRLTEWHQNTIMRLRIDIEGIRRKRAGIDRAVHFFPGLVNDNNNFRSIKKETAKMISAQVSGHEDIHHPDDSAFYEQDVQLIAKGGKVFYLPN